MQVAPDGPSNASVAYVTMEPGELEQRRMLNLVGPSGCKFWWMAGAEGMPARALADGEAHGPAQLDGKRAWVGNVFASPTGKEKPPASMVAESAQSWLLPRLPRTARVIVAIGREATLALATGKLASRRQSIEAHCASVIPAAQCAGFIRPPTGSVVIPMRHPSALLRGSDEWYPSSRLALRRAALVLRGMLPAPPPRREQLFAVREQAATVLRAATSSGAVSIDLETTRDASEILIGGFCVDEQVWVFDAHDTLYVASLLFANPSIRVDGQNHVTFDLPRLAERGVRWPAGGVRDTRWMDGKLRPRMPHNLAHMAAHWLPWAPPNWKHLSDGVSVFSEQGRRYCGLDAWYTWHLARVMEEQFEQAA